MAKDLYFLIKATLINLLLGKSSFNYRLAILNYNIAYLCFTQNVIISLDKCSETLEALAMLCEAPNLGSSRLPKGQVFHLEVEDVIDSHLQLSQRPWEVVDIGFDDELWDLIDQDVDLDALDA